MSAPPHLGHVRARCAAKIGRPRHRASTCILIAQTAQQRRTQRQRARSEDLDTAVPDGMQPSWPAQACRALAAAVLSAVTLSVQLPATAEQTLRLPVSDAREIQEVQKTLFEAWDIVNEFYYDSATLVRASGSDQ